MRGVDHALNLLHNGEVVARGGPLDNGDAFGTGFEDAGEGFAGIGEMEVGDAVGGTHDERSFFGFEQGEEALETGGDAGDRACGVAVEEVSREFGDPADESVVGCDVVGRELAFVAVQDGFAAAHREDEEETFVAEDFGGGGVQQIDASGLEDAGEQPA